MTELHVESLGRGPAALLVHGSFGWGLDTFPEQRALVDRYRLMLVDRRGFGRSPDGASCGWPTDMDDVAALLDELGGAHLLGHSYGGVVSLLAAGLRPERVRSLVVIEPPLFEHAPDGPAAVERARLLKPAYERAADLTAAEFVSAWASGNGMDASAVAAWTSGFSEEDWAAAEASRRERWPGDAPVAFEVLARAPFRKVVAVGAWRPEVAPNRERAGQALRAASEVVAGRIGAEIVIFRDSSHNPQLQEPERFNDLLRRVWAAA